MITATVLKGRTTTSVYTIQLSMGLVFSNASAYIRMRNGLQWDLRSRYLPCYIYTIYLLSTNNQTRDIAVCAVLCACLRVLVVRCISVGYITDRLIVPNHTHTHTPRPHAQTTTRPKRWVGAGWQERTRRTCSFTPNFAKCLMLCEKSMSY
jgi:hypothetical protein